MARIIDEVPDFIARQHTLIINDTNGYEYYAHNRSCIYVLSVVYLRLSTTSNLQFLHSFPVQPCGLNDGLYVDA